MCRYFIKENPYSEYFDFDTFLEYHEKDLIESFEETFDLSCDSEYNLDSDEFTENQVMIALCYFLLNSDIGYIPQESEPSFTYFHILYSCILVWKVLENLKDKGLIVRQSDNTYKLATEI